MAFESVVMAPDDFETWLAEQAAPAPAPQGTVERQGQAIFRDEGWGSATPSGEPRSPKWWAPT